MKIEDHTYTDDRPVSALVNGQNDLPSTTPGSGQVYSDTQKDKYGSSVDSCYRRFARFINACQ
jgi:hypothetical protein